LSALLNTAATTGKTAAYLRGVILWRHGGGFSRKCHANAQWLSQCTARLPVLNERRQPMRLSLVIAAAGLLLASIALAACSSETNEPQTTGSLPQSSDAPPPALADQPPATTSEPPATTQ
jgi:hypothetical protein